MFFLNRLKEVLFYDGLTKDEYNSIEALIIAENNRRLKIYNYVAVVVIFIVLLLSFLYSRLASNRIAFIYGILSNIAVITILNSKAQKNILVSKIVNFYFVSLMLLFTAFIGTVTNNGLPAVTFLTILALVPYITYSKILYGFIHRTVIVFIFLFLSYSYKTPEYFYADILHLIPVFIISTLCGMYFQRLHVNSFVVKNNMDVELKKMSGIFETIRVISLTDGTSADYSIYSKNDRRILSRNSNASEQMEQFIDTYVSENSRASMHKVCDIATLEDRMYSQKIIEHDFISIKGNWERTILIVIEEDERGFPSKIAFTIKKIADQYYIKQLGFDITKIQ